MGSKELQRKYNRLKEVYENQISISDKYRKELKELEDRLELKKVTRVEVIDKSGRAYTNWNTSNKVELSFQDEDRTLKVFIK